jgi:hypothetical protein
MLCHQISKFLKIIFGKSFFFFRLIFVKLIGSPKIFFQYLMLTEANASPFWGCDQFRFFYDLVEQKHNIVDFFDE